MSDLPRPVNAWHLPWEGRSVPHAVLDICRGCNISCKACYNTDPPRNKPLAELESELEALLRLRRLSSVSLAGGEVTLHPDLDAIVSMVKSRGLAVELLTNGLDLTPDRVAALKTAGVDIVYLHIERGQHRPDMPPDPTPAELRAFRESRIRLVAEAGIDVGLTVTVDADELDEARDIVRLTLESPHVNYLLVTLNRDVEKIAWLEGDLETGLRGEKNARSHADAGTEAPFDNYQALELMRSEFGLEPFGVMGSNRDRSDPRWLSYLVGTLHRNGQTSVFEGFRHSAFERLYLRLSLRFAERYPMYLPQKPGLFRMQLLFNALTGGRLAANLRFLARSLRPGTQPYAKRILFQNPAELAPDGTLIHCRSCPDAVLKNGGLVPVCIADRVRDV